VRAIYAYTAQDTGELSLNEGDIITVTDKSDADWWDGILHGVKGAFPKMYTEPI